MATETVGLEVLETREWLDSLDYVLSKGGPERAGRLLQQLALHARDSCGRRPARRALVRIFQDRVWLASDSTRPYLRGWRDQVLKRSLSHPAE